MWGGQEVEPQRRRGRRGKKEKEKEKEKKDFLMKSTYRCLLSLTKFFPLSLTTFSFTKSLFLSFFFPLRPLRLCGENLLKSSMFTANVFGGTSMATSLYKELTRIGIDDELAHNVDKALDPAHVATKEDVVIMQEAILQTQLKAESRYHELNNKIDTVNHSWNNKIDVRYHELDSKMDRGFADLRAEIASMNRQYLVTFGGLITTILTVFLVNLYFHL